MENLIIDKTKFGEIIRETVTMKHCSWARGYISRILSQNDCVIHYSKRLKLYYLDEPNLRSSQYHTRQYFSFIA